jgi:hypothetical protein
MPSADAVGGKLMNIKELPVQVQSIHYPELMGVLTWVIDSTEMV